MRLYAILYLIYNILGLRVAIRTLVVAGERRRMVETCKTMLFQRFQYYITRVNSKRQDNIKSPYHTIQQLIIIPSCRTVSTVYHTI